MYAKPKAIKLLHEGTIALSQVEQNGIKIDLDYLNQSVETINGQIREIESTMRKDEIYRLWHKTYGERTNLRSRDQLGDIFFNRLKYPCKNLTATGKYQADEKAFASIDHPFVKLFFKKEKLNKLSGTYLKALLEESVDGYLRPFFNLHTVRTYRSSSSNPNFQNIPIRNPEVAKYIRSCFIPRKPNRHLVEIDYSGIEVRIAATYHKDPTMLAYINDPTKDMHRDMAMECYMLSQEEVSKEARYAAKNMYVFPVFYGSYYVECSKNLWDAIDKLKLTANGVPLKEHLKAKGIRKRGNCDPRSPAMKGTFEEHIQKVEHDFWNKRFKVYADWKTQWMQSYINNGGFYTHTGFWIGGDLTRNEVINFPVQSAAFHCLLQSLIWIQNEIKDRKMKTKIVGQIHDSILADVPESELVEYTRLAREVMTQRVPQKWKWINVPLEIEAEVSPAGKSWFEKKSYSIV